MRVTPMRQCLWRACAVVVFLFPFGAEAQSAAISPSGGAALFGADGTNSGGSDTIQLEEFTGATTYQLTIPVPPARGSLEPNIVLNYNSQRRNANSWVGYGWELEMGAIYRLPTNGQIDYVKGTSFEARFAGQSETLELKQKNVKASDYGLELPSGLSADLYTAKIESAFNLYFRLQAGDLKADAGWLVIDKSGLHYRFGNTVNSREEADTCLPGEEEESCAPQHWIAKWVMTEVKDPNGNELSISYTSAQTPLKISYQDIVIHFHEKLPAAVPHFPNFMQGFAKVRKMARQLADITIYQKVGASTQRLQKVRFAYEDSQYSAIQRLVKVTRFGLSDEVALPALTFSYYGSSEMTWGSPLTYKAFTPGLPAASGEWGEATQLVDMNGDGLVDQVVAGIDDTMRVYFNNGGDFGTWSLNGSNVSIWEDPFKCTANNLPCKGKVIGKYNDYQWLFLEDLNGDHLPDRVARSFPDPANPNVAHFIIAFNTGSGWNPDLVSWKDPYAGPMPGITDNERSLIDMNGDSLVDRVVKSGNGTGFQVFFNYGAGFKSTGVYWKDPLSVIGIAGRGQVTRASNNSTVVSIRDMNGDGLPDRVWRAQSVLKDGTAHLGFIVALNRNGLGWAIPQKCPAKTNCYLVDGIDILAIEDPVSSTLLKGYINNVADFMDFNGDGFVDRVAVENGKLQIHFYRGVLVSDFYSKLSEVKSYTDFFAGGVGGGALFSGNALGLTSFIRDMNGDGLPDRVRLITSGGSAHYEVWPFQVNAVDFSDSPEFWQGQKVSQPINLLKEVKEGTGGRMAIEYVPSSWPLSPFLTSQRLLPFAIPLAHKIYREDYSANTSADNSPEAARHPGMRRETLWYEGGNLYVRTAVKVYPDQLDSSMVTTEYFSRFNGFQRLTRLFEPLPNETWSPFERVIYFHQAKSDVVTLAEKADFFKLDPAGFGHYALSGKSYKSLLRETYQAPLKATYSTWEVTGAQGDGFSCKPHCVVQRVSTQQDNKQPEAPTTMSLVTSYDYDAVGNLTHTVITNGSNQLLRETFNDYFGLNDFTPGYQIRNRLKKSRHSLGGVVYRRQDYAYDSKGNPTVERRYTSASSYYTITRAFNEYGNIVEQTGEDGVAHTLSYDALHLFPVQETIVSDDTLALTTHREYNRLNGQVSREITPQGAGIELEYDDFGRLITRSIVATTGSLLPMQRLAYEYLSLPAGESQSLTLLKSSVWNYSSDYASQSAEEPMTVSYSFQGETLQQCQMAGDGVYRTMQRRSHNGNREQIKTAPTLQYTCEWLNTLGDAPQTITHLDVLGQVTLIDQPKAEESSPLGDIEYHYEITAAKELLKRIIQPDNHVREERFDEQSRLTQVTDEAGSLLTYSYNPVGELLSVTGAGTLLSSISYNMAGQKTKMVDVDLGTISYEYDGFGRLITQTDNMGQKTTFDYNAINQLLTRSSYNATGSLVKRHRYIYDASDESGYDVKGGELYRVHEFDGAGNMLRSSRFSYDSYYRRIEKMARLSPGIGEMVQSLTHDAYGQLKATSYPNDQKLFYHYSRAGTVEKVCAAQSCQSADGEIYYTVNPTVGYDLYGAIIWEQYGNGVEKKKQYYPISHRMSQMTIGLSGEPYFEKGYTFDTYSNMTAQSNFFGNSQTGNLTDISYDFLNRLSGFYLSTGDGNEKQAISYDDFGNITQTTDKNGVKSYTYDPKRVHAVIQAGTSAFSYDANGNMIFDPERQMSYDTDNQLVRVEMNNKAKVEFEYDFTGTRVLKKSTRIDPVGKEYTSTTHYLGEAIEITDGQMLMHIYANGNRIATKTVGKVALADAGNAAGWIRVGRFLDSGWPLPITGLLAMLLWMVVSTPSGSPPTTRAGLRLRRGRIIPSLCKGGSGRVDLGRLGGVDFATRLLILPLIFTMVFPTWLHAGDAGQEPIPISDAEYFFYIAGDHLGSSSILTEGMKTGKHMGLTYKKGQLLQKYEYQPFGQESHVLNPNLWMDPRFTDQSLDLETGLYYYKARYYNPKLKRFIQPDSIVPDPTDLQSWNRYSYVKNNPLKYTDPTGHEGENPDDFNLMEEVLKEAEKIAEQVVLGTSTEETPAAGGSVVEGTTNADENEDIGAADTEDDDGGGPKEPGPAPIPGTSHFENEKSDKDPRIDTGTVLDLAEGVSDVVAGFSTSSTVSAVVIGIGKLLGATSVFLHEGGPFELAGGIIGGIAGAKIGAEFGASIGLVAGPYGAVAGAIIGGVIGGVAGSGFGGMLDEEFFPHAGELY